TGLLLGPRKPTGPGSRQGRCCVVAARPPTGGTDGSPEPCKRDTTAPTLGRPPIARSESGAQPELHWIASCPPRAPTTERMKTHLSAMAAIFRKVSPIWIAGALV